MKYWLVSLAAAAALAGCATTQHTIENLNPFSPPSSFQQIDTNGDGVISPAEANAYPPLAQNFRRVDSNGDGNINPNEWKAATTFLSPTPGFDAYDLNGDGFITEQEADSAPQGGLQSMFDDVDADGDGNISPAEFNAATVNLLKGISFDSLDTDHDGAVSKDEAQKNLLLWSNFGRVDLNGDGQISRQEYQQFESR